MSAWMAASSAPGTAYSELAGIIMAATVRKSARWPGVSAFSADIASSIEQIGEALLHLVGDVERDGLEGGGRIDATRGDEQAAVDDEQVLYIVRTAPFVDHGPRRIGAHARGAEQMPAAIEDRVVDAEVCGTRSGEDFLRPRDAVFDHLLAVLADRVIDPRRRDAVAVLQPEIERDAVMLLRQILADGGGRNPMAVELAEDAVVVRAPRQNAFGLARDRFEHRPGTAAELDGIAAHETAGRIGIVEFLAPQAGRRGAVAVGRRFDIAVDLRIGMEHQVLADQPAGIGKPVRKAARR